MHDIIIIGGGLSGLVSANILTKQGLKVLLIEKKQYPFHRVCGEYISNEVIPFLKENNLFPEEFQPADITQFQLTSIKGKSIEYALDLGGFGISRYHFDDYLYRKCKESGVQFQLNSTVEKISFQNDRFNVMVNNGISFQSALVIGAFGKRSNMDFQLKRKFIQKHSPYIGVKYHIKYDHPNDLISLHNFKGGYCGISNVENGVTNLCYLGERSNLKAYGNIQDMERAILMENPFLEKIFNKAEFIFKKPLVINEISFETKTPVEDHVLMTGDAAGMITPLCGNGMAIAIRSAKILADVILKHYSKKMERNEMEKDYTAAWMQQFKSRLWAGRKIQSLFGRYNVSELAVGMAKMSPGFRNTLMRKTHGIPF